jgi:YceI-like protein
MALPPGSHRFGPDNAELIVRTYREGLAAKAGHDLIIVVQVWDALLEVGDGGPARLELNADARSLHPRDGLRGVKPLTDRDRREIRKNIDDQVLGGQPISFRSTSVEGTAVSGELTMAGTTRPARFELTSGEGGELTGRAELVQSEWGIKPYRGLMGALKVRDSLEVEFEGRV